MRCITHYAENHDVERVTLCNIDRKSKDCCAQKAGFNVEGMLEITIPAAKVFGLRASGFAPCHGALGNYSFGAVAYPFGYYYHE